MPMFIFISGFLFSFLHYKKHKYPRFIDLFKNKFKRLIIPYWAFFPITALCLGKLFQLSVYDFLYPMGHLWFLLMLFWCFVFTKGILACKLDQNKYIVLTIYMLIYVLAFFHGQITKIGGLQDFSSQFIYFFTGFIVNKYDNILKLRNASLSRIIFLGFCACLFCIIEILLMNESHFTYGRLILPASSILIVIFGYSIVNKMLNKNWIKAGPVFEKIDKMSYGIYMCHSWFINLIMANSFMVSVANKHYILFPLILFIVVLGVSILFSVVMLKTRIGRFLIG